MAAKKPEPVPAAPKPVVAEAAAEAQSQADIDALFAADEPDEAPADDVFDLTEAMRAPEPEPAPVRALNPPGARPRLVETQEPDLVFAEPTPPKAAEPVREAPPAAREESFMPKPTPLATPASIPAPPSYSYGTETRTDGRLVSSHVDQAVSGSFSNLANLILSRDARTLEDLVSEMLRPMLKTWLDDNLPHVVERLVREEIERVARAGRR